VQLPTGTVTLLFTDIEGSTRLWDAEPQPMAIALRRHDSIMRAAIEDAAGYVFKTVGDAFCAAFETAQLAAEAAVAAQRALGAEPWPTSRPIRVRMALHTGVCEERDGDYFGPVVNRIARLEAVAHGGQVLLSGVTGELLSDALPAGLGLRDLGMHRLRDLGRPEHVYQLEANVLPSAFPPLPSLDNPELPNNLPSVLSAFIGREQELADVRDLVGSARLVTLTGAGGSGKTRLALQAAAEQIGVASDGVWFADLAPLTEDDQVARAVAAALGLPEQTSPAEVVTAALAGQESLIVLDNCEHLIDSAAELCGRLIRRCPRVRLLATSREPLGIDGERVYRVPSLTLPGSDAVTADELAGSDAVRLFVARARMHDPRFVLDDTAAPLVATICRRLDGIPLALELAAAQLSSMSLAQVAARLDQRFRLLTGGSRNAMPRQQTLLATVDWSFGLLSQAERDALTRMSVFVGGFELEAAEAICGSAEVDALDVMDLLGSLVDKSLVVADRGSESVRYRLLETIRQYSAQELVRAAGEAEAMRVRDRHAAYCLALAEAVAPRLTGPLQGRYLRRLDTEWGNLRAAFTHLRADARNGDVLRLGVAMGRFVLSRGHTEVIGHLGEALAAAENVGTGPDGTGAAGTGTAGTGTAGTGAAGTGTAGTGTAGTGTAGTGAAGTGAAGTGADGGGADGAGVIPDDLRARAHQTVAQLTALLLRKEPGELPGAKRHAERALELARLAGNRAVEAKALSALFALAFIAGDAEQAQRLSAESVVVARSTGDTQLIGELLTFAAIDAFGDEARRAHEEALANFRASGDVLFAANELHSLSGIELVAGRTAAARAQLELAIALVEELGDEVFLFGFRSDLTTMLLIDGKYEQAALLLRQCLLVARRTGIVLDVSQVIFGAACIASWQGEHRLAARLFGAADTDLHAAMADGSIQWTEPEQQLTSREHARLRGLMGDGPFEEAFTTGAKLTRAAAVELALSRDGAQRFAINSR
jgi:predicted ATPase/class 3 adenylate cyclase